MRVNYAENIFIISCLEDVEDEPILKVAKGSPKKLFQVTLKKVFFHFFDERVFKRSNADYNFEAPCMRKLKNRLKKKKKKKRGKASSDVMNFDSIDACRSNLFKNLITGGDSKGFCKI